TDGDVDDEAAHANEEEDGATDESSDLDGSETTDEGNGDAGASSDLDGSETINDESGNTANEQHGQENPSTTNVGEKSAEAESAQVTFAVANDNGSAEDFEYSIKEVTETSFVISWNTVPNISSYDL